MIVNCSKHLQSKIINHLDCVDVLYRVGYVIIDDPSALNNLLKVYFVLISLAIQAYMIVVAT